MPIVIAIVLFAAQSATVAEKMLDMYDEMAHVEIQDPWSADPLEDAIRVARSETPYLLLPNVIVPAPIPPYKSLEAANCWIDSVEIRLLDGFTDSGGYEFQKKGAVLALYAHYFNGYVMRELESSGKSQCKR